MNSLGIRMLGIIYILFFTLLLKTDRGSILDKDSKDSYEIKHPNLLKLISIFGSLAMSFILINGFLKNEKIELWIWGGAFLLLMISLGLVIETLNWKLIMLSETFYYRTFFKNSYIFRYDDIDKCAVTSNLIIMKVRDKWLFIDPSLEGVMRLMDEIEPIP